MFFGQTCHMTLCRGDSGLQFGKKINLLTVKITELQTVTVTTMLFGLIQYRP